MLLTLITSSTKFFLNVGIFFYQCFLDKSLIKKENLTKKKEEKKSKY